MRIWALQALALILVSSGCATYAKNASFLHGERYHRARINTYPTLVSAVDGRSTLSRQYPVPINPGRHVITLVTAPAAGFSVPEYRDMELDVAPCKRYYIVAERDNRLLQDWRPVIDEITSVGGPDCQ